MKRLMIMMLAASLVSCHEEKKEAPAPEPQPPTAPAAGTQSPNQADSFAKAKESVTDDGYIVFAYAADWDRYSESFAKAWITNEEIQKAAGSARLLLAPVYQADNEKVKKALNDFWGFIPEKARSFQAETYPAIMMFDKDGRHYADIYGPDMLTRTPADIAADVAGKLELLHRQADLLKKAGEASGAEAARLLGEAATLEGIAAPEKMLDRVKQADPEDESGYVRRLSFNGLSFADQKRKQVADLGSKDEKWAAIQEVAKEVEGMLEDKAYTNAQKQEMCSAVIGVLHRDGGYKGSLQIPKWAKLMTELDPESILGRSGKVVPEVWSWKLNYAEGWTPSGIPDDKTPIALRGDLPISDPGSYTLQFMYQKGKDPLRIAKVMLYDGDELLSEDEHEGEASKSPRNNSYTVTADAKVKKPRVFIIFDNGDKRDSYGIIRIDNE